MSSLNNNTINESIIDLRQTLISLLSTNPNFVDNNNSLIIDKILLSENKKELISLLLSNDITKEYFFEKVFIDNINNNNSNYTLIFKETDFITFLKSKSYLFDSYTSFKNEIGFSNKQFLNENVVLDFPYKDCILEGGQTKNDEKGQEKFFNKILCKDEIKRMFEPKLFTNYQRIKPEVSLKEENDIFSRERERTTL